jgi:hypothetical protein
MAETDDRAEVLKRRAPIGKTTHWQGNLLAGQAGGSGCAEYCGGCIAQLPVGALCKTALP